jgi:hypothetical protein
MDILKMLAEMRQERAQIEKAILVLERLARGRGPPPAEDKTLRRGRQRQRVLPRSAEGRAATTGDPPSTDDLHHLGA